MVSTPVSGSIVDKDDLCDEEDVEVDIIDTDENLPKGKRNPRSKLKTLAIKCRESLSMIQSATISLPRWKYARTFKCFTE